MSKYNASFSIAYARNLKQQNHIPMTSEQDKDKIHIVKFTSDGFQHKLLIVDRAIILFYTLRNKIS